MGRKFQSSAGQFGVLVALITGVNVTSMETTSTEHLGSSGTCYNRRRISNLESSPASAKIGHSFHRHSQGKKVKSFVPGSKWGQNGEPGKCTVGHQRASNESRGSGEQEGGTENLPPEVLKEYGRRNNSLGSKSGKRDAASRRADCDAGFA